METSSWAETERIVNKIPIVERRIFFIFLKTKNHKESFFANIAINLQKSLLICCKAFQPECESAFKNIAIKKIPKMLLGRCEFDKNNYNLNIISLPEIDDCEENED